MFITEALENSPRSRAATVRTARLNQPFHEDRRYRRPLLDSRAPIIDGYLKWFTGHVRNQEASMSGNVVYVGIDVCSG